MKAIYTINCGKFSDNFPQKTAILIKDFFLFGS